MEMMTLAIIKGYAMPLGRNYSLSSSSMTLCGSNTFLITDHKQCHKSAAQLPVLVAGEATNHKAEHKRSR